MKTSHTSFNPILCHQCGKPTHISTRVGTPMPCAEGCGAVHVVTAIEVSSGDDVALKKEDSAK